MRALGRSWRITEVPSEGRSPTDPGTTERFIYAYWHEYIIPTVGHYRGCPIHALASQSFDGELITATMLRLGYPSPARGSSSRAVSRDLKNCCGACRLATMWRSLWTDQGARGAWLRTAC